MKLKFYSANVKPLTPHAILCIMSKGWVIEKFSLKVNDKSLCCLSDVNQEQLAEFCTNAHCLLANNIRENIAGFLRVLTLCSNSKEFYFTNCSLNGSTYEQSLLELLPSQIEVLNLSGCSHLSPHFPAQLAVKLTNLKGVSFSGCGTINGYDLVHFTVKPWFNRSGCVKLCTIS